MKKKVARDIFFGLLPGKRRVRLNFRFEPVKLDEKTRTGTFELILDDPRWRERKIDGETFYVDSIDGYMISTSSLVESFERTKKLIGGKKGIPIYLNEFMSENKGAKTIAGINKLISLQKTEEAFLSCHSMFLKRLRVLLFLCETQEISLEQWHNWNKKFRGANMIVQRLVKFELIEEGYKESLLKYNRDRNKIDHEIAEGIIESRDIIENLIVGIDHLNKLEDLFVGLSEKIKE